MSQSDQEQHILYRNLENLRVIQGYRTGINTSICCEMSVNITGRDKD